MIELIKQHQKSKVVPIISEMDEFLESRTINENKNDDDSNKCHSSNIDYNFQGIVHKFVEILNEIQQIQPQNFEIIIFLLNITTFIENLLYFVHSSFKNNDLQSLSPLINQCFSYKFKNIPSVSNEAFENNLLSFCKSSRIFTMSLIKHSLCTFDKYSHLKYIDKHTIPIKLFADYNEKLSDLRTQMLKIQQIDSELVKNKELVDFFYQSRIDPLLMDINLISSENRHLLINNQSLAYLYNNVLAENSGKDVVITQLKQQLETIKLNLENITISYNQQLDKLNEESTILKAKLMTKYSS